MTGHYIISIMCCAEEQKADKKYIEFENYHLMIK